MNGEIDQHEDGAETPAEVLLQQLMHLKTYEVPETARMTRNRQNIMREIRNAQANPRRSLGDLIESSMPWFFAEPKYGIAALFIAFVGLQYIGINARTSSQSTGIYTSNTTDYSYDNTAAAISTNRYPRLPDTRSLFESPTGNDGSIVPVGFKYQQ